MGMTDDMEIEDKVFDDLLEEKRHQEVMKAFKQLTLKLSSDNGNSGIAKAIGNNTEAIKGFIEKIGNLKFDSPNVNVQPPNVTVHQNQDKVVKAIEELSINVDGLSELIVKQNEYLEELCQPKQWEFNVVKDDLGRLKGVKAIQLIQKVKKLNY